MMNKTDPGLTLVEPIIEIHSCKQTIIRWREHAEIGPWIRYRSERLTAIDSVGFAGEVVLSRDLMAAKPDCSF